MSASQNSTTKFSQLNICPSSHCPHCGRITLDVEGGDGSTTCAKCGRSKQFLTRQEIHITPMALNLAMQDAGVVGCDWLSSRASGHELQGLDEILGGF